MDCRAASSYGPRRFPLYPRVGCPVTAKISLNSSQDNNEPLERCQGGFGRVLSRRKTLFGRFIIPSIMVVLLGSLAFVGSTVNSPTTNTSGYQPGAFSYVRWPDTREGSTTTSWTDPLDGSVWPSFYLGGWQHWQTHSYNTTLPKRLALWSDFGSLEQWIMHRGSWWNDEPNHGVQAYFRGDPALYNSMFNYLTKGLGITAWRYSAALTPPSQDNTTAKIDQWYSQVTSPGGEWYDADLFMSAADGSNFEVWIEMAPGYTFCNSTNVLPNWNTTRFFLNKYLTLYTHHSSFAGYVMAWHEGVQGSDCLNYSSSYPQSTEDFSDMATLFTIAQSAGKRIATDYGWRGSFVSLPAMLYFAGGWGDTINDEPWTLYYRWNNDTRAIWNWGNGFSPMNPSLICSPGTVQLWTCNAGDVLAYNSGVWINGTFEFSLRNFYFKYITFSNPGYLDLNLPWVRNAFNRYPVQWVRPSNFGDYLDFSNMTLYTYNSAQTLQVKNSTSRIDTLSVGGNTMELTVHGYNTKYWLGWTYNATLSITYDATLVPTVTNGTVVYSGAGVATIKVPFDNYLAYGATATDVYKEVTIRFSQAVTQPPTQPFAQPPTQPRFLPPTHVGILNYLILGLALGFALSVLTIKLSRRRRRGDLLRDFPREESGLG